MKTITAFTVFWVVVSSSTISKYNSKSYNEKYEVIVKQTEAFYKTLPKEVLEDARLLVPELVQKYGYPCERHTVITPEGYILEMHRIPYGKDGASENRPAVYLQHGLMSSSADWVIPGPGKAFAYVLADAGYDVWIPNVRGTRYSRKHVKLDPDKDAKKFWDFSWHEVALDDVPAMIDHVITHTKQEKIFYVGHSMGTTVSYVLCAEKSEYNDRFRAVISLAPAAYEKYLFSPLLRILAPFEWGMEIIANLIGWYEYMPHREFLAPVGDILCSDESVLQILCTNALFAVSGFNPEQMNATLLPVVMGHTPAGSSTKQHFHFAQSVNSGKFRQWDYGMIGNIKHYGSMNPPKYKLKNIKAPFYLFYSRNDWLSSEKDVNKLYSQLPNVQGKFLVPDSKFNHLDYVYAIDAPKILYSRVLSVMDRH